MYPFNTLLSLLMLLASTLAAPHDEDKTTVSPNLKTTKVTKTVVVTVTQTSDTTVQPPVSLDTTSYRSGYATPPPPGSVPTGTDTEDPEDFVPSSNRLRPAPTLICSRPSEACIIDGIAIWPSGTTSITVPGLTLDPLPTSTPESGTQSNSQIHSPSTTSSGSLTVPSNSTTCPHSMSHFVPGKPTSPLPSNPGTPTPSAVTSPTSQLAPLKNQMSILPIDLGTPQPAPTSPPTNDVGVKAQVVQGNAKPEVYNSTKEQLATSTFKTRVLDPVGWAGVDGALGYTKIRRGEVGEENKATKRRESFWSRFFVNGMVGRLGERVPFL